MYNLNGVIILKREIRGIVKLPLYYPRNSQNIFKFSSKYSEEVTQLWLKERWHIQDPQRLGQPGHLNCAAQDIATLMVTHPFSNLVRLIFGEWLETESAVFNELTTCSVWKRHCLWKGICYILVSISLPPCFPRDIKTRYHRLRNPETRDHGTGL